MRRLCGEAVIGGCSPGARVSLSSIVMRPHATGRLRLLIVVGTGGTLVAALRNPLKIALADVNRQPPNSAALPLPQGSHSLCRCRHCGHPFVERMVNANPCQGLNGPRGCYSPAGRRGAARRVGEHRAPGVASPEMISRRLSYASFPLPLSRYRLSRSRLRFGGNKVTAMNPSLASRASGSTW